MPFPLPTLAATISLTGITAPPYADVLQSLQASFQAIYGTDAYIDPDSQDGQLLAIVAKAIVDTNDTAIAIYNSFSPATAQGVALSNAVKINGIARASSSNSQVVVTIIGQIGATITGGIVGDTAGNQWALPASVVIPTSGFINVTATAMVSGAIEAPIGAVNQIVTPTLGWQSVTNATEASTGAPVESDAALRQRQVVSVALPSQTVLAGIVGAVATLPGVTQVKAYENDTGTTDANGIPGHSIAMVVLGGVAEDIARTILNKKTPGAGTYGNTLVPITDAFGILYNVRFSVPTEARIVVNVTIKALAGYSSVIGDQIKASIAAYINNLGIGKNSDIGKLYLPAQFFGGAGSQTFEVNGLAQSIFPLTPASADVVIGFAQRATSDIADITLTVT